jgi:copper chaperone CopZ
MTTQAISPQHLSLPIQGMTCQGCAANVERALNHLPGVQEVKVDLLAKQAQVAYDPTLVGFAQMAEVVAKAGYTVSQEVRSAPQSSATQESTAYPWRRPILFSLLGMAGLISLYLGIVSLAEG